MIEIGSNLKEVLTEFSVAIEFVGVVWALMR
jgi:hypothetical protein